MRTTQKSAPKFKVGRVGWLTNFANCSIPEGNWPAPVVNIGFTKVSHSYSGSTGRLTVNAASAPRHGASIFLASGGMQRRTGSLSNELPPALKHSTSMLLVGSNPASPEPFNPSRLKTPSTRASNTTTLRGVTLFVLHDKLADCDGDSMSLVTFIPLVVITSKPLNKPRVAPSFPATNFCDTRNSRIVTANDFRWLVASRCGNHAKSHWVSLVSRSFTLSSCGEVARDSLRVDTRGIHRPAGRRLITTNKRPQSATQGIALEPGGNEGAER